jgi:hypothetical protein
MKNNICWLLVLIGIILPADGFAQKIKIGYDKGVDFSKYKTYTWTKPGMPVTRPFLYENVVGEIDQQLKSKGFQRIDKDGDLMLVAAGGIGFGYNQPPQFAVNAAFWTGDSAFIATEPLEAEGTLVLQFIDRSGNKMVWKGVATEGLDPDQTEKSLTRIENGIDKLLKSFPPKSK